MLIIFLRKMLRHRRHPTFRLAAGVLAAAALNVVFGLAFYFAERGADPALSVGDSMWWSMVTMTTVGYGDYYPQTWSGRFLVAYPCFLFGIGLIGYLLGTIVESVFDTISKNKKGLGTMHYKDHLVICHCPSIAKILEVTAEFRASGGAETPVVVVSDQLEEIPEEFRANNISLIKGLPASEATLIRAAVPDAAGVIVLSQDRFHRASDAQSFAVASIVAHLTSETPARLIVEVANRENMPMMKRLGAHGLVPLEGFSESLLVQELMNPGLRRVFDELVTYHRGAEFYITSHQLPPGPLVDHQIAALQFGAKLQIVGLISDGKTHLPPPEGATLGPDDQLVVIAGDKNDFHKFQQQFLTKE